MDLHGKEKQNKTKQDPLSKLGAWRSQERVEWEGEGGEQRKMYSSVRTIKNKQTNKQKGLCCVLFLKCCLCHMCQAGVTLHCMKSVVPFTFVWVPEMVLRCTFTR